MEEKCIHERSVMEARLLEWLSVDNLNRAYGKTREQIFEMFGNDLQPIAYIPNEYLALVDPKIEDEKIYCGKAYFIDHALRNHAKTDIQTPVEAIDARQYLHIQAVLDDPDSIKETFVDGKRTIVFIKKIGRYYAELTQVETCGKIVLHKSYFNQKKEPYAKLDDIRSCVTLSEGGTSSISRVDIPTPAISLESRDNVITSAGKDNAST